MYFGEPVCGKPYTPKAWDASAVKVTGIKPGTVCKPNTFTGMRMIIMMMMMMNSVPLC